MDDTEVDRPLDALPADADRTLAVARATRRSKSGNASGILLPFLLGCAMIFALGMVILGSLGLWWFLKDSPDEKAPSATSPPPSGEAKKDEPKKDDPKKGGDERWTVLFRSDNPALWNTASKGRDYAIPLDKAPAVIRYVRLRRMDTGEALILPLSRDQLGRVSFPDAAGSYSWNGTAKFDWNGRHLGIAQSPRYKAFAPEGLMVVAYDGWDVFVGSGFSHKCFKNDAQYYCWKGQEIGRTVFEIAVTDQNLSDDEKHFLLTR